MKRMIDADELIRAMKDRDKDCGEPKNAVDKGYSLAVAVSYTHLTLPTRTVV